MHYIHWLSDYNYTHTHTCIILVMNYIIHVLCYTGCSDTLYIGGWPGPAQGDSAPTPGHAHGQHQTSFQRPHQSKHSYQYILYTTHTYILNAIYPTQVYIYYTFYIILLLTWYTPFFSLHVGGVNRHTSVRLGDCVQRGEPVPLLQELAVPAVHWLQEIQRVCS